MTRTEFPGLLNHLVRDGLIDIPTAKKAAQAIQQQKTTLTHYLVTSQLLSSQTIFDYCKKHFELPLFDTQHYNPAWLQDPIMKRELICHHRVIPLHRDHKYLHLGITDPTDHTTLTAIEFHTGLRIRPMLMAEAELDKIIHTYFLPNQLHAHVESALSKMTLMEEQPLYQENTEQNDEPIIELADQLIQNAIAKHASDIHIEPYEHHCRIRFRCDGLLYEIATFPLPLATRVITRLKIMANLNIAERRLPQDGRIQFRQPEKMDIRVNTCPTLFGEKMVLRILNIKHHQLDITSLGLTPMQQHLLLDKLAQPQGLILVTGPTGSGKTITLYSALHHLNQTEKNISTVEDPIEIELSGINQVNVNPAIGLDFSTVLRTFLRQDPDIIMVGEIRDTDTATIAMQAAQTGHLVLSTLHTNSAAETITRLQSMGMPPYHLIHSISLIIAQRLVRKLCPHCQQPPSGCDQCLHGYQGRIGIFELIPVTEALAHLILSSASITQLATQIKTEGWMMLEEAGWQKVQAGITSTAEVMRVVGTSSCH
ncbi:MAG: type IV-A pilus assembly ATPase PilB [Gammaproteobacteria bacterium]|nr:MAG: type IV-A pilus assembly ATPase PilB [Gammaproteobacteria bacterium]